MRLNSAFCGCIALALFQFVGANAPDPQGAQDADGAPNGAFQVGGAVRTTSGTVIGKRAGKRPEVSEYLGIRYARPPVGDLRFAAPQKFTSDATGYTTIYGPDCPASPLGSAAIIPILPKLALPQAIELLSELGQVGNNQSEDCLSLNVWTKPQTGERRKAVLFWIYGGGFQTGSTNNPGYNGQYFADTEDVVVVSANYRENIFGFPGLPNQHGVPQNIGLLDQRLAVEWVRQNIAGFGGDPERITIFGQSAGGGSVDYYSYAWKHDPIVNGFIAESGTVTSFADPPPTNNTEAWFNASIALGCGGPSVGVSYSIACVRTKPFQDVLKAITITDPLKAVLGNFGPTSDGRVVFSDYDRRGAEGNFIRKPFFTGSNFNEAGLFKILALAGGLNISETNWAIFNLAIFQCPAAKAAQFRRNAGLPVWRYLYFGDFPNLVLTNDPPSGAWHGAEIPIVFQTAPDASGLPDTPAELSISKYLSGAWASFAKDPARSFRQRYYSFPEYDTYDPSLLLFAVNNQTRPFVTYPVNFDALCPLLEFIGGIIPGGLTGLVLNPTGISMADIEHYSSRARSSNLKNMPENPTQLLQDYVDMIQGKKPAVPPPKNPAAGYGPPPQPMGAGSFAGGVTEDRGLPRGIYQHPPTHWNKDVTEPETVEMNKEGVEEV